MDITFAKRTNDRAPVAPMSASVHRRGKHLYLHVRLARAVVEELSVPSTGFAGVGFSSDGSTLALRWGVDKESGWAFSQRADGSVSCSVKIEQFEGVELTPKFHFAGPYNWLDSQTVTLTLDGSTRQ